MLPCRLESTTNHVQISKCPTVRVPPKMVLHMFIVFVRKLFYIVDNILRYDFGHALAKCLKRFVHQHTPNLVYVHIYDFVYLLGVQ